MGILDNIFGNLFGGIDKFLSNIFSGGKSDFLGNQRKRKPVFTPKDISMPGMESAFGRAAETKTGIVGVKPPARARRREQRFSTTIKQNTGSGGC